MSGLVVGEDGRPRCPWGTSTPEYQQYHDDEWGRPEGDEDRVFEMLCLEGFQTGLSWLTILRKRAAFRQAFAGFDPYRVAEFDDADVERLLLDPGIVRHRGKILATIQNARATVSLRSRSESLAGLVWSHEPARRRPLHAGADVASSTEESKALSAVLRRDGFRFVGPTTAYVAMQALGVVNDHLVGCWAQDECERARRQFVPPTTGPAAP